MTLGMSNHRRRGRRSRQRRSGLVHTTSAGTFAVLVNVVVAALGGLYASTGSVVIMVLASALIAVLALLLACRRAR